MVDTRINEYKTRAPVIEKRVNNYSEESQDSASIFRALAIVSADRPMSIPQWITSLVSANNDMQSSYQVQLVHW